MLGCKDQDDPERWAFIDSIDEIGWFARHLAPLLKGIIMVFFELPTLWQLPAPPHGQS